MSKLEELIERLCPKGVNYLRVGDICNVRIGDRLEKNLMNETGEFPVYGGGKSQTGRFNISNATANSITIGRRGTIGYVNFISEDFWGTSNLFIISTKNFETLNKFVFYALKNQESSLMKIKKNGGTPAIDKPEIYAIIVPVPPLQIQQEIVRILDTFTTLEAELEAELEARKKQYKCFREFQFSANLIRNAPIEKMGLIFDVRDGTHDSPKYYESGWPLITSKNLVGGRIDFSNVQLISEEDYININRRSKVEVGDLIMGMIGTIGNPTVIVEHPNFAIKNVALFKYKGKSNIIFLKYFLEENMIKMFSESKGSAQKFVSLTYLRSLNYPLIGEDDEDMIASKLANFEIVINDLDFGLPAEIAARRKQYEYYRNKLLTFKEVKHESV